TMPDMPCETPSSIPPTLRRGGGSLLPKLVALGEKGEGQCYPIGQTDCWIGRDPGQCTIVLGDDPMVSPRHVRIYRDDSGQWRMEDAESRNGTWLRINKVRF